MAVVTLAADRLYHRRRRPVNADMAGALQDTRWLTPSHRRMLTEGKLRLPDQANHFGHGGHPALLVSVPDGFTSPCAWIDAGMAELVWLLNHRHDVETLECCQGQPGLDAWGQPGDAYIAFPSRRDCDRFLTLAGDSLRGERVERSLRERCVRFPHGQVRQITRTVRNT